MKRRRRNNSNENDFHQEYNDALTNSDHSTFNGILSHHAALLVRLAIQNSQQETRQVMNSWVKIHKLNNEWVKILCPVSSLSSSSYFDTVCNLVHGYSDIMGDYIIDKEINPAYVEEIVENESRFYNILAFNPQSAKSLKQSWKEYTTSIMNMVNELEKSNKKNNDNNVLLLHENYFVRARECLIAAQLLGSQLDFAFRERDYQIQQQQQRVALKASSSSSSSNRRRRFVISPDWVSWAA